MEALFIGILRMIKFECKSCSGCCHGGISVTFKEAVGKYYNYFPFLGIFSVADVRNVPIEKDKDNYSKSMKNFSKENLSFYLKTKDNRKIVVHPQIISLNHPELPCLNLDEDRLCSIYSFKPKSCSLYPVRIDTPFIHMEKGLLREKQRAFEGSEYIPCGGWINTENIIFTSAGPKDKSVLNMLNERAEEAKETTRLLKIYLEKLKEEDREIDDKLMRYSSLNENSTNVIQFNIAHMLIYLAEKGKISSSYLSSYVKGQINAYRKLISFIKNKNDDKYNLILNVAKVQLSELLEIENKEV